MQDMFLPIERRDLPSLQNRAKGGAANAYAFSYWVIVLKQWKETSQMIECHLGEIEAHFNMNAFMLERAMPMVFIILYRMGWS